MVPLNPSDLIELWEQGRTRHAIDRALLLFAAARPDLPADRLADLPLGQRNAALLRLRQATFGPEIHAYLDCPGCRERMELALRVEMFLPPASEDFADGELESEGFRFRVPTSRDLAALLVIKMSVPPPRIFSRAAVLRGPKASRRRLCTA